MFLRITANGLSREDNQERVDPTIIPGLFLVDPTIVPGQNPDPAPIQVPGQLVHYLNEGDMR